MRKIAFVVSTPITADAFLNGHVSALSKYYQVDLISNFPEGYQNSGVFKNCIRCPIHRSIHPWQDFVALLMLIRILTSRHYDAVHSVTPKAGLLAMLASWITQVPVRHHTFTGQVWATKSGFSRWVLRALDKLTHRCSTHSLIDSLSQREFLLQEKVVRANRTSVLASGSISGVDISRFTFDPKKRDLVRRRHGFIESDFVILFLGRVNKEKGIFELISAFRRILEMSSNAKLLIVGPDESRLFEDGVIESSFSGKLVHVGYTREPEAYFCAADIFCLPSHREGFGSVLIEAAACGLTCVASNIYGVSDAVLDGETGLLHAVHSDSDLTEKLQLIMFDVALRERLARNARRRACDNFSSELLEFEFVRFYRQTFDLAPK